MRRAIMVGAAIGAIIGGIIAGPASAQTVLRRDCQLHEGPDGPGGASVSICVYLTRAEGRVYRSLAKWSAANGKVAEIHFRRISFVSADHTVEEVGPFIRRNNTSTQAGTPWFAFGGSGWSMIRASTSYHVCWPGFAGDPCGAQTWLATPEVKG